MSALLQTLCLLFCTAAVYLTTAGHLSAQTNTTSPFFLGVHIAGFKPASSLSMNTVSLAARNPIGVEGGATALYRQGESWLSLQARLSYGSVSPTHYKTDEGYPLRIQTQNGADTIILGTTESALILSSSFITTDLLAIASPFDSFNLGFVGGLSFSIFTKADYKATYSILSPEGVRFPAETSERYRLENNGRTIVVSERPFSGSQLSATAGVNYVFAVDGDTQQHTMAFVPSVLYSLPLTSVVDEIGSSTEWQFSQLRIGLDVLFRL